MFVTVKTGTKLNIKSDNYLSILKIINSRKHKARLVGGVVRDSLLGIQSEDIDIVTTMHPTKVVKVFQNLAGYKILKTGIKYGTVSVLYRQELFEITTLRRDISSDGRHVKVKYTKDFYLDALRRDFTINAMTYCPFKEKIYDYFGGIKDLEFGYIKFIGDPETRVKEDYLRILRFFRFLGKFGKQIDLNSLKICKKYSYFIKSLSRERINSELNLILSLPNYYNVLKLMNDTRVLQESLPLSDNLEIYRFIIAERAAKELKSFFDNESKYALLFALSDCYINYRELIKLKFSRIEARNIEKLLSIIKKKVQITFF